MTQLTPRFRLSDQPDGLGLSCDASGLELAGVPLLRKGAQGFAPRSAEEIAALLRQAYGEDGPAVAPSGLRTVAEALNRGELAKAMVAAVHLRLPELDADGAVRLILADHALAKYDADEDRNADGEWTDGTSETAGASESSNAPSSNSAAGPDKPVRAHHEKHDVILENSDGSSEVRTGGSAAWRTNNPGNMGYTALARRHGAIGEYQGFAIFPDEVTGTSAQRALITSKYKDSTIDQMVSKWAPPNENDTSRYQALLSQWTGLKGSTKISALTPAQISSLMEAQRRMEGWKPGSISRRNVK